MNKIVVVPVYRSSINEVEKISYCQCCRVFKARTICLVAPEGLDLTIYKILSDSCGAETEVKRLDIAFFQSIQSYNRLMLDIQFYERFKDYDYMLIYQLDAWVFRDELDYWCGLGYDYIGAPWFENYGTYEDGNKLWAVGNGGFSLRRIRYFIDLLEHNGPIKDANTLGLTSSLKNRIYKFLYAKGYQNRVSYFRKDPTLFEDVFYTVYLKDTRFKAKVPSAEEAASFAFEKSPSYLFSCTRQLPFGCHAWLKNEYETFWFKYIKKEKNM